MKCRFEAYCHQRRLSTSSIAAMDQSYAEISASQFYSSTKLRNSSDSSLARQGSVARVREQRRSTTLTVCVRIFTCDACVSYDSGFVFSVSDLHSKSGLRSGCVLGDFMCKFTFTFVFALPTETCRGCAELADTSPGYIYVPWLKARDLLPAGSVCQT